MTGTISITLELVRLWTQTMAFTYRVPRSGGDELSIAGSCEGVDRSIRLAESNQWHGHGMER